MLIYGKNPIKDLYKTKPELIKRVFVDKKKHQAFFIELKKKGKINIYPYSDLKKNPFTKIGDQGIVAEIFNPILYTTQELIERNKGKKNPIILILDQIVDPQNFGAILRNVSAFGGDGVIVSKHNSTTLTPTTIKTSSGTWINVDIAEETNLNNSLIVLKNNGYWIASTVTDGDKTLDDLVKFDKPLAIILGNESKGIKKSLIKNSDLKVAIKMSNETESLNVSAATAVILHYLKK